MRPKYATCVARIASKGNWLDRILACFAGELAPADLVDGANQADAEQVCEAYYYAGEACLLDDRSDDAVHWFRRCLETGLLLDHDSTSLDPMNEYHLARWRLDLLGSGDGGSGSGPIR